MADGLTPDEALLSVAAAQTRVELHLAYLALIDSGGLLQSLGPPDVGDGTAGTHLLGDDSGGVPGYAPRLARRARNVAERQRVVWLTALDADEPLDPPVAECCPGSDVGLVHRPEPDRYDERCTRCGTRLPKVAAS